MQRLDTIHDYLSSHSEEIGARILASYPALHGADEAPLFPSLFYAAEAVSGADAGHHGCQ